MNVFISGPALTSAKNLLSVWDWGGGRTPFFVFKDFKLRIKNETQYIAINHNLWSWLFLWENWFCLFFFVLFFHLKQKWSMAFNIFFLSYTWQSVGFLFHVIYNGCFCAHVFLEFSLNDCTPGELNLKPLVCVCGHGREAVTCPCGAEATVSFFSQASLSLGVANAAGHCKQQNTHKHTQQKHAHNQHVSPMNSSVLLVTIVTVLVLKPLATSSISFYMTFHVFIVR